MMAGLSAIHRNHILQSFLAIHRQLSSLDAELTAAETSDPLSTRSLDLSPAEVEAVRARFARIGSVMQGYLRELKIPLDHRRTSMRWWVESSLIHLQVELDGFNSRSMSGYGPVDEEGSEVLNRISRDLGEIIQEVRALLQGGSARRS